MREVFTDLKKKEVNLCTSPGWLIKSQLSGRAIRAKRALFVGGKDRLSCGTGYPVGGFEGTRGDSID